MIKVSHVVQENAREALARSETQARTYVAKIDEAASMLSVGRVVDGLVGCPDLALAMDALKYVMTEVQEMLVTQADGSTR